MKRYPKYVIYFLLATTSCAGFTFAARLQGGDSSVLGYEYDVFYESGYTYSGIYNLKSGDEFDDFVISNGALAGYLPDGGFETKDIVVVVLPFEGCDYSFFPLSARSNESSNYERIIFPFYRESFPSTMDCPPVSGEGRAYHIFVIDKVELPVSLHLLSHY